MAHRTDRNGTAVGHAFLIGFKPADWLALLGLFIAAALALYAATSRWPQTPDGLFHLQRVRSLSEALAPGVLFPRWFPDFAFEYGHPILNYYAPAFYYPPALLHWAGIGVLDAVRFTLALVFGLSGVAMYALLRAWVSLPAALVGSVLYLAFPYRLYDLFIRGALPEFAAFLWLPLILLVAVVVARRSQAATDQSGADAAAPRVSAGNLLAGSLVWAMLVLTHNLTAMMAALTLGGILVVVVLVNRFEGDARRFDWPLVLWGLVPILLGAMLVAWYIAPALMESTWVGIGADPVSTGYANHFVNWQHLFDWSPIYAYPEAADPMVPLPGYLLALVVAGLLLLPLAYRTGLLLPLGIGLLVTIGAIWLTTDSSAFLWHATAPVLGKLQFPWRWQTIVALGAGLLAAVVLELALRAIPVKGRYRSVLAWGLVILAIGYVIVAGVADLDIQDSLLTNDDITREQMWAFDAEFGQVGMTWTGEFLPRWVSEQRWAIGREPSDGSSAEGLPGVDLSVTPQQLGYQSARYQVDAAEPTTLIWHRFYFPAWQVSIDGEPVETFPSGDLGLLSATAPSGKHIVALRWTATPSVQAGRLLGVVAWALLLALLWFGKARRYWFFGWLLAGVLIAGLSFLPTRQTVSTPIGADYGSLRLESSIVGSAKAGENATVQLDWLVVEPSPPLNAFVHVVDGAGTVVAQNDGPLAGAYTPSQRWTPGLLLQHKHTVPLPDALPPGDYLVKAGVYEPGQAGAPLMPVGQSDPRVDVGWLEVRP